MVSFKDFIDAAKIVAGIAGAAVASGPAGAATAAFTASGAAHDLSERLSRKPEPVTRIAGGMDRACADQNLTGEQRALIIQMTETLDLKAIVAGTPTRDPGKLADAMLATLTQRDYLDHGLRHIFHRIMSAVLGELLGDKATLDELRPVYEAFVADRLAHIAARVDHLVAETKKTAQDLGLTHGLVIGLARSHGTYEAETFDQAMRGITAALQDAAAVKARGALPQNLGDHLQTVLRWVAELNDQGRLEDAADTVDAALHRNDEEKDRQKAERLALLDLGIAQDRIRNNPESAAARVVEKTALDSPAELFKALCAAQDEWCESGRDKGLNFDLAVAIALSRACIDQAESRDHRAVALNNLANALLSLGDREQGPERLEEAVKAYDAALAELNRDLAPLDWAKVILNLGTALQALEGRKPGTGRLEEAVAAYRDALTELTRDRAPLDWAKAQMNLGTVLQILGEIDAERLEEAVAAYRAALAELTSDRAPLDWAKTQMNLGNSLQALGQRELDTPRLEESVVAYRAALTELTRDRVPLDWAKTQMNLGCALLALGERETATKRPEESVAAFSASLEEGTRNRVPLDWARTQMNLGNALRTLGRLEASAGRLTEAIVACRAALTEFSRDRAPLDWAKAQLALGNALLVFGRLELGTAQLEEALAAYRAALEEFTRDRVPLQWANTTGNLGLAQATLAVRTHDLPLAREALASLTLAEHVLRDGGHIPWAGTFARQIPDAQALVERLSQGPQPT